MDIKIKIHEHYKNNTIVKKLSGVNLIGETIKQVYEIAEIQRRNFDGKTFEDHLVNHYIIETDTYVITTGTEWRGHDESDSATIKIQGPEEFNNTIFER